MLNGTLLDRVAPTANYFTDRFGFCVRLAVVAYERHGIHATVIIYFGRIYPKDGTEQTLLECVEAGRPYLLIDAYEVSEQRAAERLAEFVAEHGIERVNLAGPKAQGVPQAHAYTQVAVFGLLQRLK